MSGAAMLDIFPKQSLPLKDFWRKKNLESNVQKAQSITSVDMYFNQKAETEVQGIKKIKTFPVGM